MHEVFNLRARLVRRGVNRARVNRQLFVSPNCAALVVRTCCKPGLRVTGIYV